MLEHSSLLYPGREDTFRRSLAQLRQDIMKANTLVREANIFADEMGKQTTFGVTLQIPPQNLSPNRKRSAFVSEPAILVKRKGKPNQVKELFTLSLFTILVVCIILKNYYYCTYPSVLLMRMKGMNGTE